MHWRRTPVDGSHDLAWFSAWGFVVGAGLFALGSFPLYSQRVDPGLVGITFVVGSVFFTSAAYGQYVQVVGQTGDDGAVRRRFFGWQPHSSEWVAATVQLAGTVLFNVSTFLAMLDGLTTQETNRLVWAPDVFGCTAFLIASHLAWRGVCGRAWCVEPDSDEWWMAAINYAGSIFFGISAIAALTLPTSGEELNTTLVYSTTLAGALCFMFGAYLMFPADERTSESRGATD